MDLLAAAVWTGAGANGNWTNAANWQGNVAPVAGSDLMFNNSSAARLATNNDFAAGTSFNSITFAASGYSIGGNPLKLSGGINNNTTGSATGTNTISNNVTFIAAATVASGFGSTLFLSGAVSSAGYTLSIAGLAPPSSGGTGGGSGSTSGIVDLTGTIVTANSIVLNSGVTLSLTGPLGSLGSTTSIVINQGGTLVLDNTGTNNPNRVADNATIEFDGGAFEFLGNSSAASVEKIGTIQLASGHSTIFSGGPSSAGTTLVADNLIRNLTATVDFLDSGSPNSLGSAANRILFTNAPTLINNVWPFAYVNGQDFATYSPSNGVVAFSAYLPAFSGGTATNVKVTGTQTLASSAAVNSLVLTSGTKLTLAPGVTLAIGSGGLIAANNVIITGGSLLLASEAVIATPSGTATISSTLIGAGGLTKTNFGTLLLATSNTYSGDTTLNAGTLAIDQDTELGNTSGGLTFEGGQLQANGAFQTGRPVYLATDGTFNVLTSYMLTLDGQIDGPGALSVMTSPQSSTPGGIVTLTAANTYTGGTRVDGATLTVAADANLGAAVGSLSLTDATLLVTGSDTTNRTVMLKGNVTVDVSNSNNLTVAGSLSGNGNLAKQGPGTLTFLANDSDLGNLSLIAGTIAVSPSGAQLPANLNFPGILSANGFLLSAGATLALAINGPTPGSSSGSVLGYDQIVSNGPISLGGATLSLALNSLPVQQGQSPYRPMPGDTLTIIQNNSGSPVNGTFAGLPEGAVITIGGSAFTIHYHGGASGRDVTLVAGPQITNLAWAGITQTDASGTSLTKDSQPTINVTVTGFVPGPLTVALDGDGSGFNDGQVTINPSGYSATVPITLARPLYEGTDSVRIRVTDAAGNSTISQLPIDEDRTGPTLAAKPTVAVSGSNLVFTFKFNEPLDPSALTAANVFLTAPPPGASISNINYQTIANYGVVTVTVALPYFSADGVYQVTLKSSGIDDLVDNSSLGGDVSASLNYSATGPVVTSVTAINPLGGKLPDTILVAFSNSNLDPSQATYSANYTLRYSTDGVHYTLIPLAAPEYSGYGNLVVLHAAASGGQYGALQLGTYQLTVYGLTNLSGVPMSAASTTPFTVTPQSAQTNLNNVLNNLVSGDAQTFDSFVTSTIEQAKTAQSLLAASDFAALLLNEIQLTIAATEGGSAAIATAVNARIAQVFQARQDAIGFNPSEYVVIWGDSLRFLLTTPADNPNLPDSGRSWIGYNANGTLLQNNVPNSVVVSNLNSGSPSVSSVGSGFVELAIVPVELAAGLVSTSALLQSGNSHFYPNINFHVELQGLAGANQGGVVYFSPSAGTHSQSFVDQAQTVTKQTLQTTGMLTGLGPQLSMLNAQILEETERLFGDFSRLSGDFLIVWFDPVDFTLTDSQGNQVSLQSGQTTNTIPNAFFSVNSTSNLLVVPSATAGNYNLSLTGTGGSFQGSVDLVSSSGVTSVPLQGSLASGTNVTAVLDFRGTTTTSVFAITGIDRLFTTTLGLRASLTNFAFGLATLAARSDLVAGVLSQFVSGQPDADSQTMSEALVLYAADRTTVTFSLPGALGTWQLTVVELNDAAMVPGVARLTTMRVVRTAEATRLVLQFHRAFDPAQATNPANYTLTEAGPNGALGDGDDRPIAIPAGKIQYEAEARRVTIDVGQLPAGRYQLQLTLPAPAVALDRRVLGDEVVVLEFVRDETEMARVD